MVDAVYIVCADPEYSTVAFALLKVTTLVPVADKPDKAVELASFNVVGFTGTIEKVDVLPAALDVCIIPVKDVVPRVRLKVELKAMAPEAVDVNAIKPTTNR